MRAFLWRHIPKPAIDLSRTCAATVPNLIQPYAAIEAVTDSQPVPVDETGILPACVPPVPRLYAIDAKRMNDPATITPIRFATDNLDDWGPRLTADRHVAALIEWLQYAGHGGSWATADDLEYAYSRLCEARGWQGHAWNMVAKSILRANGRQKRHPRAPEGEKRPRIYFIPPRPSE
jgi:hypothetical protein